MWRPHTIQLPREIESSTHQENDCSALSKLSSAPDTRLTSTWSGCESFSWLQNNTSRSLVENLHIQEQKFISVEWGKLCLSLFINISRRNKILFELLTPCISDLQYKQTAKCVHENNFLVARQTVNQVV